MAEYDDASPEGSATVIHVAPSGTVETFSDFIGALTIKVGASSFSTIHGTSQAEKNSSLSRAHDV
jgi:hypothetical protein